MMVEKSKQIHKKWHFWVVIASIISLAILVLVLVIGLSPTQKIAICTEREGNAGPCIKKETVEIVAKPDNQTGCPDGTKPVYNSVGGIVGIEFVGCTKK